MPDVMAEVFLGLVTRWTGGIGRELSRSEKRARLVETSSGLVLAAAAVAGELFHHAVGVTRHELASTHKPLAEARDAPGGIELHHHLAALPAQGSITSSLGVIVRSAKLGIACTEIGIGGAARAVELHDHGRGGARSRSRSSARSGAARGRI